MFLVIISDDIRVFQGVEDREFGVKLLSLLFRHREVVDLLPTQNLKFLSEMMRASRLTECIAQSRQISSSPFGSNRMSHDLGNVSRSVKWVCHKAV